MRRGGWWKINLYTLDCFVACFVKSSSQMFLKLTRWVLERTGLKSFVGNVSKVMMMHIMMDKMDIFDMFIVHEHDGHDGYDRQDG